MRKIFTLFLFSLFFIGCATTKKIQNGNVEIKYLDEYILAPDLEFENTRFGGISGIDYAQGKYFLVSDQASEPRIYTANIEIENDLFKSISINELIKVQKGSEFSDQTLDLEAIRFDKKRNEILVTSEGMIADKKDPGIYRLSRDGKIQSSFTIPEYFKTGEEQQPRNNGVFEGISESYDQRGYWVATELPLEKDASKPKIFPTKSHVRITKFDKNTGEPMQQFTYNLDGISKLPINYFAVNGITEILEYAQDKFLVLERAYSAGYGSHGNTVKIFEVDASQTTNTLKLEKLRGEKYKKAEKKLLFNFKSVKDQLTEKIVDNIEGMCFGPKLANGKQSLILVSDNNFNSFAEQLNQFILLEITFKNSAL